MRTISLAEAVAACERDPEFVAERERHAVASAVSVWLVRYRAEHDLSQRALARLVGLRPESIARLESGDHEPRLSTLLRLSVGLGMPIDLRQAGPSAVPITIGADAAG